jgi:ABC-type tungstate transport system substrate-binding protein
MRPASIVNFERVVLLSLVLGVVGAFLIWDQTMKTASVAGMTSGTLMTIQAVTIGLYLLLLYFISRKGSPIAKWIYVALAVLGLVVGLAGFQQTMEYGTLPLLITIVQYALTIYSLWLLFRPDAKAYFADGRG